MLIKINNEKAIEITKEKIRNWREAEFTANDIAIQNALIEGADTAILVARRDYLRDLPNQCEDKTLDELKALMNELGVL